MKRILARSVVQRSWVAAMGIVLIAGCSSQRALSTASVAKANLPRPIQSQDDTIHPGLTDPSQANEQAPDKFQAIFKTVQGDFTVEVNRRWAPHAADRFYNMVRVGYFTDIAIFRAVDGFMFQFGIHGDPAISEKWSESTIKDDPRNKSNVPGTLSFAQTGRPNSRSVQIFVNLGNNANLDVQAVPFVPFGKIVKGLGIMGKINTEYGENPRGEDIQGKFKRQGNDYIKQRFPNIDYIQSVEIVPQKPS